MAQIIIEGVPIRVQRKRIKNMYLRVLSPDGEVLLTAPMRIADASIERFARSRIDWVRKTRAKYLAAAPARYESGATVPFGGMELPLCREARRGKPRAVRLDGAILLSAPPDAPDDALKAALDGLYRAELIAAAEPLLALWARRMGVRPGALTIRDMSSRYGTCNTKTGRVTLNLRLMRTAPVYLEYIVVHELAHLIEPSHNARFYAVMDRFLPDWKTRRKQLKALPL